MKRLIVDANILIRAMLGVNVLSKLERHRETVQFLTSETAYLELERHLPRVLNSKHPDPEWQRLVLEVFHYCAAWLCRFLTVFFSLLKPLPANVFGVVTRTTGTF